MADVCEVEYGGHRIEVYTSYMFTPQSAPADLAGHRRSDPLYSLLIQTPVTPAQMLDPSTYYSYDALP